jgi:hypothetical protein
MACALACTPKPSVNAVQSRQPANLGAQGASSSEESNLVGRLPAFLQPRVQEYLQLLGLEHYQGGSVGGANRGIVAFNWDLLERNNCFRNLATQFYLTVHHYNANYGRNFTPRANYLFNNLSVQTGGNQAPHGWRLSAKSVGFAKGLPRS